MYLIKLRPGHPTGMFVRAGIKVENNMPAVVDEITPKLKNELWFVISEITPMQLEKMKNKFRDYRAAKKEVKTIVQPVHAAEVEKKTSPKGK